jgi:hypothetical protein
MARRQERGSSGEKIVLGVHREIRDRRIDEYPAATSVRFQNAKGRLGFDLTGYGSSAPLQSRRVRSSTHVLGHFTKQFESLRGARKLTREAEANEQR